MPPDVTGLGGASGGASVPPTAPVRPVSPSRALVPVDKTGARPLPAVGSPLSRSGVALADLLFAADLVETREAVAPVAMEIGLESARGQLLRQLPGEALVALDAVWSGARFSEEGWYLRSGALTIMGHPSEGDRVATEGLASQPSSLALRLMQSVARAVVGDLSGARAALTAALDVSPNDPVLMAQQAVVLARQGHADDAASALTTLSRMAPDHPALTWARSEVRAARADRSRGTARPASESGPPMMSRGALPAEDEDLPLSSFDDLPPPTGADGHLADPDGGPADVVTGAFSRLGGRLPTLRDDQLIVAARTMLRACSTGGAMASACMPEEAHAARQVLSALLIAVRQDVAAPSPLTPVMAQLLPLLRGHGTAAPSGHGRWADHEDALARRDEAERVLRRFGASVTPSVRRLLETLLHGATMSLPTSRMRPERSAAGAGARVSDTGDYPVILSEERDAGPLVPVRLGLSLLADSAATRAFERSQRVDDPARAIVMTGADRRMPTPVAGSATGGGETNGTGWGAARAADAWRVDGPDRPVSRGTSAALPAILLAAAALVAVVNGSAAVAALLGGAAVFLALRRAPDRND